MFRFTWKPSSGSHNQYLAKNTGLVQCRYRRRTHVVSVMAAYRDYTKKNYKEKVIFPFPYWPVFNKERKGLLRCQSEKKQGPKLNNEVQVRESQINDCR